MNSKTTEAITEFDWDSYESMDYRKSKGFNETILKIYPESRVYSTDENAIEMYEMLLDTPVYQKDCVTGDIQRVTGIKFKSGTIFKFQLENGMVIDIDLKRERRFCEVYQIDIEGFKYWLDEVDENEVEEFLSGGIYMELSAESNDLSGSLIKGHEAKIYSEFMDQIKNPTSGYIARVLSRNQGGFLVNIQGVNAFLPGGLAAPNKIVNFDDYIGKDIIVMVEDYLKDTKTFIVSNKKYISHIMPSRIDNLDITEMYTGYVTGTAKFGIFVEFDEIFTGLIHTSKMSSEMKADFKNREFKPGDSIDFWIKEITRDKRIILTSEDPSIGAAKLDSFMDNVQDTKVSGVVISNKEFGVLVKLDDGIVGLIPKREVKKSNKTFNSGETVEVKIKDRSGDKIYLTINNAKQ